MSIMSFSLIIKGDWLHVCIEQILESLSVRWIVSYDLGTTRQRPAASGVIPAGGAPRRMDRSLCPANMMAGRWAGGRSVEEATIVSLFSTGIRRHERVQWCSRVTSRHVLPVHLSPVIISKLWLSDEWEYIIFKCICVIQCFFKYHRLTPDSHCSQSLWLPSVLVPAIIQGEEGEGGDTLEQAPQWTTKAVNDAVPTIWVKARWPLSFLA